MPTQTRIRKVNLKHLNLFLFSVFVITVVWLASEEEKRIDISYSQDENPTLATITIENIEKVNSIAFTLEQLNFEPQQVEKNDDELQRICVVELVADYWTQGQIARQTTHQISDYCYTKTFVSTNLKGDDEVISFFSPDLNPDSIPTSPITLENFREDPSIFLYPLNRRDGVIAISLIVRATDTDGESEFIRLIPNLDIQVKQPTQRKNEINVQQILVPNPELWFISFIENPQKFLKVYASEAPKVGAGIKIKQSIEIGQIILTGVLLITLLSFILSLLKILETGTFLEVAAGILLGLWGVHEVLIPNYIVEPILIHSVILALYALLAVVSIVRWRLSRQLSSKNKMQSNDREQPPKDENDDNSPVGERIETILPIRFNKPQAIPSLPQSNNTLSIVTAVFAAITALITLLHFIRSRR